MGGTGGQPGLNGMPGMPPNMNMADMMNNPMVQEMMKNPEMIKMAQQMMGSMGGNQPGAAAPMPDANKMQEMMQNPSISKFIDNPEFLHSTVQMLKNPGARGQVEMISKQANMNPDTLIKVLEFLVNCAFGMKKAKNFFGNPIIKYGLLFLVLSLVLKWFGFTSDYLFMMPVKEWEKFNARRLLNDDD